MQYRIEPLSFPALRSNYRGIQLNNGSPYNAYGIRAMTCETV